jgi:hypothetical protein
MNRIWRPQVAASLMLFWALNPDNPYGYYILLRWVCCGIFAYLAVQTFREKNESWTWILAITAIIYNPIFIIHLTREFWIVVNLVTIAIAMASIRVTKRPHKT